MKSDCTLGISWDIPSGSLLHSHGSHGPFSFHDLPLILFSQVFFVFGDCPKENTKKHIENTKKTQTHFLRVLGMAVQPRESQQYVYIYIYVFFFELIMFKKLSPWGLPIRSLNMFCLQCFWFSLGFSCPLF